MGYDDLISRINSLEANNKIQLHNSDTNKNDHLNKRSYKSDLIVVSKNLIKIKDRNQYFIAPHPIFDFYVNDKLIMNKTAVSSMDNISWSVKELDIYTQKFKLHLTEDLMELYLEVFDNTDFEIWPKVVNINQKILMIEHEKKYLPTGTLRIEEILIAVDQLKLKTDVNIAAISKEITNPTGEKVLIARGIPPIEGKNGHLEIFFETKKTEVLEEINGNIDFKNRLRIPSVQSGEPLARYFPKEEGMPGKNLRGEIILPPETYDLVIHCNSTVMENNNIFFSAISGRPQMVEKGNIRYLKVLNQYVNDGDVSIETGNIYFSGDVLIYGNVLDGMRVEASGNIYIFQNAYRCELVAGGSVFVNGTIISSQIYAGNNSLFYSLFYHELSQLTQQFEKLTVMLRQLEQDYPINSENVGRILRLLIEQKCNNLFQQVNELKDKISGFKLPIPEQMAWVANQLNNYKNPYSVYQITDITATSQMCEKLKELLDLFELYTTEKGEIKFSNASNSKIISSGEIIVTGNGTVNCELHAGHKIHYLKRFAASRGDNINCQEAYLSNVGDNVKINVKRTLTAANICQAFINTPNWNNYIENQNHFIWKIG